MDGLKNIIKEEFEKNFLLCEVTIDIKDLKKQGYATQIGDMYADAFKPYEPLSIKGIIGVSGDEYLGLLNKFNVDIRYEPYSSGGNYFRITLKNNDVIEVLRSTSPATAHILVNDKKIAEIQEANELFKNNLPDLAKKYYSNQLLAQNA